MSEDQKFGLALMLVGMASAALGWLNGALIWRRWEKEMKEGEMKNEP
jgi:hypothetical protein